MYIMQTNNYLLKSIILEIINLVQLKVFFFRNFQHIILNFFPIYLTKFVSRLQNNIVKVSHHEVLFLILFICFQTVKKLFQSNYCVNTLWYFYSNKLKWQTKISTTLKAKNAKWIICKYRNLQIFCKKLRSWTFYKKIFVQIVLADNYNDYWWWFLTITLLSSKHFQEIQKHFFFSIKKMANEMWKITA